MAQALLIFHQEFRNETCEAENIPKPAYLLHENISFFFEVEMSFFPHLNEINVKK